MEREVREEEEERSVVMRVAGWNGGISLQNIPHLNDWEERGTTRRV